MSLESYYQLFICSVIVFVALFLSCNVVHTRARDRHIKDVVDQASVVCIMCIIMSVAASFICVVLKP